MATPMIEATIRFGKAKRDLRMIRAAGDIPAVIYGKSVPPRSLVLPGGIFRKTAVGHRMIDVVVEGQTFPAVVQDMMWHPIDHTILHVELHAVALDQTITASVPILLQGIERVEKRSGIVQQQLREAEVSGLPTAIPDYLMQDIGHLEIGEALYMRDLVLPEGVELRSDLQEVVLTVLAPKRVSEESPSSAGSASAPVQEQRA